MKTILGTEDVIKDSYLKDYSDKYVVLKPEYLKPEYREAEHQLFLAKGGFGCAPGKLGTAVFGIFCADGEEARVERYDILGIVTPEAFQCWCSFYGEPVLKKK